MFSGLTGGWSRTVVVLSLLGVGLTLGAWYAARSTSPPSAVTPAIEPASAAGNPEIPRRIEPPRARREALAGDGTFAAALERGIAAYNADDVEAAADAFEEAVRLAPSEPEPHINLGLVYMRLQRPEDGLRELATGAALQRERGVDAAGDGTQAPDGRDGTIGSHEESGRDGHR